MLIYKLLLRPKPRKGNGTKYLQELHTSDIRIQKPAWKYGKQFDKIYVQLKQLKLSWRVVRHTYWAPFNPVTEALHATDRLCEQSVLLRIGQVYLTNLTNVSFENWFFFNDPST